jgi:cbb3-type cytochrome oxidase subunit 3
MSNSEFEKQVKQKMEELKLSPDAAVWDKVEASLPEVKKRRWLLLLIFFTLISGVAVTWWLISDHNRNQQNQSSATPNQNTMVEKQDANPSANTADTTAHHNIMVADNTDRAQLADSLAKTKAIITNETTLTGNNNNAAESIKSNHRVRLVKKGRQNIVISQATDGYQENKKDGQINSKKTIAKQKTEIRPAENDSAGLVVENKQDNIKALVPEVKADLVSDKNISQAKTQTVDSSQLAKAQKKDSTKANTSVAKVKQKNKQLSLFSVFVATGFSNQHNVISNSGGLAYSTSPGTGINLPQYNSASPAKAGPAFEAGIRWAKKTGRHTTFNTGLGYSFMSNTIKTGSRSDTLSILNNSDVYRNGNNNLYHNRFQLLSVPLALQYNFVEKQNSSFFLEAGSILSYQLQPHALYFSNNNYYEMKSAFNKWLISGQAGAGILLAKNKAIPFSIGYRFSYTFSSVFKPAAEKKHLSASLIYLRFNLRK